MGRRRRNIPVFAYKVVCNVPGNSSVVDLIGTKKLSKQEFEILIKRALIVGARALIKRPNSPITAKNMLDKALEFLDKKHKLKKINYTYIYKIQARHKYIDFDIEAWSKHLPMNLIKRIKRFNSKFYNVY
ncbi:MAG: hypothetical protein OH354_04150 [Candidatus Parvarchaeota archaeon]|nr:hypothetical protein [Candidatus Jingweiarchaeum tengchongense]MCW1300466.1 hypothetical protein [Candidatus Jingweiarchaeum tengchongense]MCW1304944.1 hypothetical protein [Candidatus Jingweiarchaeum tengchongense]MCW1305496.1 hypothetical protein [Candidatus Jingweiarchaeum tengchongense]MCW1309980.1 hypothetical protein [Candidatus Jingweiarchaeum tengchongense]